MPPTSAMPALPVWPTVAEAYSSVPANLMALFRIFWAWMVLALASILTISGVCMLLWSPNPSADQPSAALLLQMLIPFAVGIVGLSSIAVAWHRLLLLGEQPPTLYLRVGRPVPRYLGRLLVIFVVATMVQMLCALVMWRAGLLPAAPKPSAPTAPNDLIVHMLISIIITIPTLLVATRLSISLPGIAIERPLTLGQTILLTRDSAWQLCGGTLLVYAPCYILDFLIGFSVASADLPTTLLLYGASFFCTVATISFLSLSYRFLVGSQPLAQSQINDATPATD